eukprot:jgi/Undpi1/8479/HiC_scaffold_25.g10946.m1
MLLRHVSFFFRTGGSGNIRKDGGSVKKKAHPSTSSSGKVVKKEGGTKVKGQADRVFYETLLKQRPESHMAQDWCLSYGVCGAADAEILYKTVCKRKGVQPSSSAPPLSNSPPQKAKKSSSGGSSRPRSSLPKDIEADTGFGPSSVFEGVGTTGF